ncbi:Negative elongation factor E [Aphelenchoides bicaudatus]|nr:Negative elongation factor E [Aphelenchoides bicaudatus]
MIVPAALTQEEKDTKQLFEQIKNERKNFEAALKKSGYAPPSKLDQRQSKESVDDDAVLNRKELVKKIEAGKIKIEKADERQTFKRNKVTRKESNPSETPRTSVDFGQIATPSFGSNNMRSPTSIPETSRGPTLYIRGYNLRENTLRNGFQKFGQIKRVHVEDRLRSAFVTFSSVEEAEEAMKKMNNELIDGVSIQVGFARRQNQDNWTPRWQPQAFVSAGFTSTSTPSNEFPKPEPIERQTFKRKLPEPKNEDRKVASYEDEDGELFDDNVIE